MVAGVGTLLLLAQTSARAQVPMPPAAVDMSTATLEQLMEIPIATPSRHPEPLTLAPATVYLVTEEDIQRYGLRNLRDVIRIIPGAEWSFDHMAVQGGLRGFPTNFSNTLLMINGREVQNLLAGEAYISFQFQTHNVKQIEVVMGPASSLYGANALVGVINIITRREDPSIRNSGYIEQAVGSWSTLSTGLVLQQTLGADAALYGSVNHLVTDNEDLGEWITNHPDTFRSRMPAWTLPGGNPRFAYRNQARSTVVEAQLDVKGFYAGVLMIQNYSEGGIEEARTSFGQRTLRREEFIGYLGYEKQLLPQLKARVEYLDFTENDIDVWTWNTGVTHPVPPEMTFDPFTGLGQHGFFGLPGAKKRRGELQLDYQLLPGNLVIGGLAIERWDLGSGPLCCTAPTLLPTSNPDLRSVMDPDLLRYWKMGFYLQDQQTLWKRLHLTLGVRFDKNADLEWIVNPRAGLVLEAWRGSSIRLLFGRAFREANVFEQLAVASEPEHQLLPARMTAYELSLGQRLGPIYAGTSAYLNMVDDAIVANPLATSGAGMAPMGARFINVEVRAWGLEQVLQLRTGRWRGFASYAFVDRGRYEDPVFGLTSEAIDLAQHKLIAGLSCDVYRTAFVSLLNVYNSSVEDVAAKVEGPGLELQRTRFYNNLTVVLGVRDLDVLGGRIDASVILDNMLNRGNVKPNLRASDPRAFIQNHFNMMGVVRVSP